MNGFLAITGILVFVVGMYLLTYYLNSTTKAPEGVEPASCGSCNSTTCSVKSKASSKIDEHCDIEVLN